MIDRQWALDFAREWIDAWNAHDMERILTHYADDFEMASPLIVERLGVPAGRLRGRNAVRDYWLPCLSLHPPLRFELIDVFAGVDTITLYYRHVGRRRVAETLFFNSAGQVTQGVSQWSTSVESE
ncbi:MAG: nuclear transport factor 2 family protein [Halioglobus sp.]